MAERHFASKVDGGNRLGCLAGCCFSKIHSGTEEGLPRCFSGEQIVLLGGKIVVWEGRLWIV